MILSSYKSPKTEFKNSPIEGKGRFAKEKILKGEVVAIRSGHIINGKQLRQYAKVIADAEHQIDDDFYLAPLYEKEFPAVMCFLNHSCRPNLGIEGNVVIKSMREISVGEELCLDYAMIFSHEKTFTCKCGNDNCRKIITGKDWMKKELQEKYGNHFSSYLLQKIRT